ncbi:SIR2 family protein [Pseudenhygromyxa sp. WMMC2535]|nr:SIR2 family protein [Pseudenhygromyxa sp. WMMC2535]
MAEMGPVGTRLDQGEYEEVAQEIIAQRGRHMFDLEVEARYSSKAELSGPVLQIRALTEKFVITTNFDEVLELAFRTQDSPFSEVWHPASIPDEVIRVSTGPDSTALIKLHGDSKYANGRVFTKSEYDLFYGAPLDMDRPLPKLLATLYSRQCMLFIGCSLCSDRTLDVFRQTIQREGAGRVSRHFAILECPDDGDILDREKFLTEINIVPIWFPKGDFTAIEALLEYLIQATGRLQT